MRRVAAAIGLVGITAIALVVVLDLLMTGRFDVAPEPSTSGIADGAATRQATLLEPVVPRWSPNGPAMTDEFGESEETLEAGRSVTLRGQPITVGIERWVKVYVLPSQTTFPGDYFAWVPIDRGGQPVLDVEADITCPDAFTLETLGPLAPADRLRCASGRELVLDGRVGFAGSYLAYNVDPAWYGMHDGSGVVSLSTAGDRLQLVPDDRVAWIDVATAPGVDPPPIDFDIRATGQFDHPDAQRCHRTRDDPGFAQPPPPDAGLPVESTEDSVTWCRERFVITGWTVLAGPERRAPVPGEVQLHRKFMGGDCGGVGMGPLRFRIDEGEVDPVWLEGGGPRRILPLFSPAFSVAHDPGLVIADATGVVIRDGTRVNPDGNLAGHAICPMGEMVSFD